MEPHEKRDVMTDSAEWLRNLARNYADGVPGMTPQDHHAWAIADEIERLRTEIECMQAYSKGLRDGSERLRAELEAEIERLQVALGCALADKQEGK
jgi:hypothetical protein